MIAEHTDGALAEGANEAQHFKGARPAVYQVTGEPQSVCSRIEIDVLQQLLELSEAEHESLNELELNLKDIFEELELNSDTLERIQEELSQKEAEVSAKLEDLNARKGHIYRVKQYAPKHEVRKLENGQQKS